MLLFCLSKRLIAFLTLSIHCIHADVDTRTTNSTTAPSRLSQQQKKQDKKKAGKGKDKDVEALLLIGKKLDAIAQERGGGNMGILVGLAQNLQRRDEEWVQNVLKRQLDLDRTLARRREEHDRELAAEKERWRAQMQQEKEQWRVQMQKDMDMVQEQKDKVFQDICRFLQQQAGRSTKPSVNQTFHINAGPSP